MVFNMDGIVHALGISAVTTKVWIDSMNTRAIFPVKIFLDLLRSV